MATQVILLEKIEKLGNMGEVVNVKPGYARNYLLPQSKALRATSDNIAYFEAQKASLEKANEEKKKAAEKIAKKLDGLKVAIIRQASEGGQLYGSVTSRDIAEGVAETSKEKIERSMVALNQNFKTIGLFAVEVALHPEVKVEVTVNIARSSDEAEIQAKTGKALIADEIEAEEAAKEQEQAEADAREELMEADALEAEKAREAEEAEKAAEDAAKAEEKSAARAEKKAARAEAEAEEAAAAEAEEAGETAAEEDSEAPEAASPEEAEGKEKAE